MAKPPRLLSRAAAALDDRVPGAVTLARRGSDRLLLAHDRWQHRSYPAPGHPHSPQYVEHHHRLVAATLADDGLIRAVSAGEPLPPGFGAGFDERVVEYPWLLGHAPFGQTLDAGSTLNHAHVLDAFLPRVASLTIATLAPEHHAFPARGISYLYADLRQLPLRDDLFDTIICASTLEHVGMDNRVYGSPAERADDAAADSARALQELERVLAPGGQILITVPYGVREDMGWQRQFDQADLDALLAASAARETTTAIFAYGAGGWQPSDPTAASTARYHHCEPGDALPPDRAVAARAVALCRLGY